jgi:hypothetical protein
METLFARYAVESPPSSLEIRLARMSLTRA